MFVQYLFIFDNIWLIFLQSCACRDHWMPLPPAGGVWGGHSPPQRTETNLKPLKTLTNIKKEKHKRKNPPRPLFKRAIHREFPVNPS